MDRKHKPISVITFFNKGATFAPNYCYSYSFSSERGEHPTRSADETLLNKLERGSISALVAYTAYDNGVREEIVNMLVASHFRTDDISKIYSRDYNKAVNYLINFNPKKFMN